MSGVRAAQQIPPLLGGEFPMPNRAPDMHFPHHWQNYEAAVAAGQRTVGAAIWFPRSDEPGYIYTENHNGSSPRDLHEGFEYRSAIRTIQTLGNMGLRPLFEAVGLQARSSQSKDGAEPTIVEMSFPGAPQFCEHVDTAVDQGLAHVRFALARGSSPFTSMEAAKSLARERMLIANPTLEQMQDPQLWYLFWHDLTAHAPAYLALSRSGARNMFRRASRLVGKGDREGMRDLTLDMEMGLHVGAVDTVMYEGSYRHLKRFDRFPSLGLNTTNRTTRRRLRQLKQNMDAAA